MEDLQPDTDADAEHPQALELLHPGGHRVESSPDRPQLPPVAPPFSLAWQRAQRLGNSLAHSGLNVACEGWHCRCQTQG